MCVVIQPLKLSDDQLACTATLVPTDPKNRVPLFPRVTPHAPNTALRLPRGQLGTWGRIKQSIWALGESLRQPEIKYSIKTGMSVAILAAPAFIESTRETFMEYRGEWALISVSEVSRSN
jgi:hypothetical protein